MHRSGLLIMTLLVCACTPREAGDPAASTIKAETISGSETAPQHTADSEQSPSDSPEETPDAPPTAKRNLLRVSPEYKESQSLYRDARRALEAGDQDSANDLLDQALGLRPGYPMAVRDKLALCRTEGHHEEALLVASQALEKSPRNVTFVYEKALSQFDLGKPSDALTTLAGVLVPEKPFPAARMLQMKALATLGDTEATLAALEAAAAAGFTDTALLAKEPLLQSLAGEPRFQSALESIERTKGTRLAMKRPPSKRPSSAQQYPVLSDRTFVTVPVAKLVSQLRSYRADRIGWAIDLSLQDIDGKSAGTRDYLGKPLILCAWGTWSVSSLKILPHLVRLKELYKEDQLEVLLLGWENRLDYDNGAALAKRMLRDMKIDLRSAVLRKDSFSKIYVRGCPSLFFVNPKGKVETYTVGYMPFEDVKTLTEAFLGKGGATD